MIEILNVCTFIALTAIFLGSYFLAKYFNLRGADMFFAGVFMGMAVAIGICFGRFMQNDIHGR